MITQFLGNLQTTGKKHFDNTIMQGGIFMFDSLNLSSSNDHSLQCFGNNTAAQMCLNSLCKQKNVFQCSNQTCICQKYHQACEKGNSKGIFEMVNSKIFNTQSLQDVINKWIDKKIDELSDFRDTLFTLLENQVKYIQMNSSETKFFDLAKGQCKVEDFTSLDSKTVWQWSNSNLKAKKSEIQTNIYPYLRHFSESITKSMYVLQKNIYHLIQKDKNKIRAFQIEIKNNVSADPLQIMKKSAICTTKSLADKFINTFGVKVKKLTYFFRASDNQFSIKNYSDICGKVENTVVICKTDKGKIIGGYTPLAHHGQNSNNFAEDASGKSFIFSLTDQKKFTLKNKYQAIFRSKDKDFIQFGNIELRICDKANTQNKCYSRVNFPSGSYYCEAYSTDNSRVCNYNQINTNIVQLFLIFFLLILVNYIKILKNKKSISHETQQFLKI